MSKRGIPIQTSISSFLSSKNNKIEQSSEVENPVTCPRCKEDSSKSCHHCFICRAPSHPFCSRLEGEEFEGFGKPTLCDNCFNENNAYASYSFEKVEEHIARSQNKKPDFSDSLDDEIAFNISKTDMYF